MLKRIDPSRDFKLLGRLFQVLGPTQDKLWIPGFALRKGSFNYLLKECVITPFSPTGQTSSSKKLGQWLFWNLKISEIINRKCLLWTFGQFNCKNVLTRIFDLLSNSKQNLMHLFCDAWRRNFNFFERFESQAVQA